MIKNRWLYLIMIALVVLPLAFAGCGKNPAEPTPTEPCHRWTTCVPMPTIYVDYIMRNFRHRWTICTLMPTPRAGLATGVVNGKNKCYLRSDDFIVYVKAEETAEGRCANLCEGGYNLRKLTKVTVGEGQPSCYKAYKNGYLMHDVGGKHGVDEWYFCQCAGSGGGGAGRDYAGSWVRGEGRSGGGGAGRGY